MGTENADSMETTDLQELGEKLMTSLTNQKLSLTAEITAASDASVVNSNKPKSGESPNKNEVHTFSARAKKKLPSNFTKRSHHLMAAKDRPYDLFRHRKQNTSRPPSMHVDDFVRADHEEQEKRENFDQISKFIDSARGNKSPESYKKRFPQKHGGFHGNNNRFDRGGYHGNQKGYFPHSGRRSGDSQNNRYPGNQRSHQPMKSKHSRTFTR